MIPVAWRWLVHTGGIDYGLPYGHWGWYSFWSGISGSFLVGLTVWLLGYYVHHTCHGSRRCLRWGKYAAAGGVFRTCWRHHPDGDGSARPSHEIIRRLHRERPGRDL